MAFSPEQIAKIRQKEEALPEALRRDNLSNYFEGYFFVTLNVRDEAPILSIVKGRIGGEGADAPHCEYTELGKRVLESWENNPKIYSDVENIACAIMPEHFHGLLRLKPGNKRHLGRIINGFMAGCAHGYWDLLGIDWRSMTYIKGARAPEWQDKDHTRSLRGPALFVRGYNDVEALTEEEVQIKIEYIHKQAERRLIKASCYDRFAISRNCVSKNWLLSKIEATLAADAGLFCNPERLVAATAAVMDRLNFNEAQQPVLDYLGNRNLLADAQKLPLVCHRADANRFEQQKEAVMAAATAGAVIVSAFISEKEREIKAELLRKLLPVIEIVDNGFSERYKPRGLDFYACGENRLVQISPWQYRYQKDAKISREMCLVMNALACTICGRADDWWK